jgi:oryzin
VEPDQVVKLPDLPPKNPSKVLGKRALVTQTGAQWGLGAISHAANTASSSYVYDSSAGVDTYGYVLSTGVLTTHTEFQGQAVLGYNSVAGSANTDVCPPVLPFAPSTSVSLNPH